MSFSVPLTLLCFLSLGVHKICTQNITTLVRNRTTTQTSTTAMVTANAIKCPFILITPKFMSIYVGRRATFDVNEEAKVHPAIEARWQRRQSPDSNIENVNITEKKYNESKALHTPILVVNNVSFEEEGSYRLQVRIAEGWCTSDWVQLGIKGILNYHDHCNRPNECDPGKYLLCSSVYNECLCDSGYYQRNKTCFWRSNLEAQNIENNLTTNAIEVKWRNPSRDSDLVHSYRVELKSADNTIIMTNKSVGSQTEYKLQAAFVPGAVYVFTITSKVLLSDPSETIYVRSVNRYIVEPLPPGPIDRNVSSFNPEKLNLTWSVPRNNTRVYKYEITIDKDYYYSYSNLIVWQNRLDPGENYSVSLVTISRDDYGYETKESAVYQEQIQTLRTPTLHINSSDENPTVPYLSTHTMTAFVLKNPDFPPVTEIKWQKTVNVWTRMAEDIDTTEERYKGSSLDLVNPVLVINRVDFDLDDGFVYKCLALNSDGWGSSLNFVKITLSGSLQFSAPCNKSRECLPNIGLECRNERCYCNSYYYHKNSTCYYRRRLLPGSIEITTTTCSISIEWNPPSEDEELISGYKIVQEENKYGYWRSPVIVSVGKNTAYSSPCDHQPGRLYRIRIRTDVQLSNPNQTFYIETPTTTEVITEPVPPGPLSPSCNYSADNLYLRWNDSGSSGFVNRYKVIIDGYEQMTEGDVPEIFWEKLLMPYTNYHVNITAVSYGYTTNYPSFGQRESLPSIYTIKTLESQFDVNATMPYGDGDSMLRGDDKTSQRLKARTTAYIGNGSVGGFNNVMIGTNGLIGLNPESGNFNKPDTTDKYFLEKEMKQIICPFWTDLKPGASGKVYFRSYERNEKNKTVKEFIEKADKIVKKYFKDFKDFKTTWLVKVTWENMTLYGHEPQKVTFQCLLISDGDNTFTVMNYLDVNLNRIKDWKIVIGYQYRSIVKTNLYSLRDGAFSMSTNPGNRGEPGVWIYKLTDGVQELKDTTACLKWRDDKSMQIGKKPSLQCPCHKSLLRFDPRFKINRFDKENRLLCYASVTVGSNIECCYVMYANSKKLGPLKRSMPKAGTILKFNPFFERQKYLNNDSKPKEQCCRTGNCNWFYEMRPIPDCYVRSPFISGINYGDPHITTLDGRDYTFNGYGEYIMMKINTSNAYFEIQARTSLVTTESGRIINASIFSAFVAKDQTGAKVQIEMSRDKKMMIILVNGGDLTSKFKNTSYSVLTSNIFLKWEEDKISASFLKSTITLKVSLGKGFLVCETLVSKSHKGMVLGLMGNFDGIKENDFILPNGTLLPENSTNTERGIFYNFGQQWLVNESSFFQYDDDMTFRNFSHLDFVPIFTDEMDADRLSEAKSKCGPRPSSACISDYLATGDLNLALSSGKEEESSKADIAIIQNETPQISGNTSINVEINKEVDLMFNASDDGSQRPVYKILNQPGNFFFDNQTGKARWTPTTDNITGISIITEDDIGAQSSVLDVSINVCPGCGDHGECNYDSTTPTENDQINQVACTCKTGYSGKMCEKETDACLQSPCSLGRDCIDLSPEEEVKFGRGYNCSECPNGFKEIDNKCADIDECGSASTNPCNFATETCENTEGSYICHCISGFRNVNGICQDIDECLELSSGCEQICQNTPGSFQCSCHLGFLLDTDMTSCKKASDPCGHYDKKCEYSCGYINGTMKCICPLGFELAKNNVNCKDINECELTTSKCEQGCINTKGSYNCTCRPGYYLNEDKTSCSECVLPMYGENCSQECDCGPGMDTCDPVRGCVCQDGWTGVKCNEDIDECSVDPFICGSDRGCQNLEGSYTCTCGEGFKKNNDECEDIDECADMSLNDCPESTTFCRNTHGSYLCECQKGFQKKNDRCEDINECDKGIHGCSQMCINVDGGYNCACYFGFTLRNDRKTCEKVKDSCSLFPGLSCGHACKQSGHNPENGVCFCEHGYELGNDQKTCIDTDECKTNSMCEQNCTNTVGSFTCDCAIGYELQNDGRSCKACNGYFYGVNCATLCKCGRGSNTCHPVTGCVCKPGWTGETCEIDVDECKDNPCMEEHQTCVNTPGSFRCDCDAGFIKSNGHCHDIDECQSPMACQQKCMNTEGSYRCECKAGYELTNTGDCRDIDECRYAKCHDCSNWPGGFQCSCREGYELNSTTLTECKNINECIDGSNHCSSHAICTDTVGSYKCSCRRGFKGNGHDCTVCQNFTFGEQCSETCSCIKTKTEQCDALSGECQCKAGWEGRDCSQDVDECKDGNMNCNKDLQVCVNTPASAHCECRYGGEDFNKCILPNPPYSTNETETKIKLEVKFETSTNRSDFLRRTVQLIDEFESSLESFYKKENVSGFFQVKVLSMRFGSLIIDYEIIGDKNETNIFKGDIATAMTRLLNGERKLLVLHQEPVVLYIAIKDYSGLTTKYISASSSPCFVFGSFGATCPAGKQCDDSNGVANCVIASDKDVRTLFIVLGVSVPLCILMVALIIVCIYHHKNSNLTRVIDIMETNLKMKEYKDLPCPFEGKKGLEKDFVRPAWVY